MCVCVWPEKYTKQFTVISTAFVLSADTFVHAWFSLIGARVFIDSKAQLTLLGTEMDYVSNKLSSEFVFNNPNVKGTCGCGESFTI